MSRPARGSAGDTALAKSWLWLKLTAPIDNMTSVIKPDAAWGAGGSECGQGPTEPFGVRTPKSGPDGQAPERLAVIRDWICAGAPVPM